MTNITIGLEKSEGEILAFKVSDEALEIAAGAAQDVTLSDSAVEQIDKGWLQRERDELRAALGRLLSDVEADVASPAAYGFPVEDEQHPYHKSVLAARKALEGVA